MRRLNSRPETENRRREENSGRHEVIPRLFILLAVLLWPLSASAQWTNEPSGANVVVDCNFSSTPGACGILDVYRSGIPVSDSTAPVSPDGAVKALLPAYAGQGGMQLIYSTPQPVREMYVGLTWRTNPQFSRPYSPKQAILHPREHSRKRVLRYVEHPGSPTMKFEWGHNTSGLDNSHTCALDSGLWCYANAGPSMITLGQWAKVEVYQKPARRPPHATASYAGG